VNFLDYVLLLLVGMYALSGYWQGFVTGAFATAGLILGGLLGIWLAPTLLGNSRPSVWISIGAVTLMIICASLGQAALQISGAQIRDAITWQPIRAVDAVGGAMLSAAAVLLVAWALGVAISGSRMGGVSQQVRASTILAAVNSLLPDGSARLLRSFNDVVSASSFPRYLEPFAAERIVDVKSGPERLTKDPDITGAEASVLKIHGQNKCGRGVEGSGFLYADNRLMTNAHVVAGVTNPEVIFDEDTTIEATVVYFNEDLDIAVLAVADQGRVALPFGEVETGDPVAIVGYPQDGPYAIEPGRVRAEQKLRSPNIYGEESVVREVLSLRGEVQPGNSGGPVLTERGKVAGVVFAASVSDFDTGYALTAQAVAEAAAQGVISNEVAATGDCAT
jgi:S1-C subfamily serine protease